MKTLSFSHKGKRKTNQDFVLIEKLGTETHLALVADGMGGYEHGDIAAKLVAENIMAFLSTVPQIEPSDIQMAVNKANLAIKQLREKKNCKVGATIGGVIIQGNQAISFWVGDVKIFLFKNNRVINESTSHSLMNDVIKNGSIKNPEQINRYKHVVTRSVQGDIENSQIEFFLEHKLNGSDLFLVCSDGVHDFYDGIQLQQILNTSASNEEAFNQIEKRLLNEAKDNFSLVGIVSNNIDRINDRRT